MAGDRARRPLGGARHGRTGLHGRARPRVRGGGALPRRPVGLHDRGGVRLPLRRLRRRHLPGVPAAAVLDDRAHRDPEDRRGTAALLVSNTFFRTPYEGVTSTCPDAAQIQSVKLDLSAGGNIDMKHRLIITAALATLACAAVAATASANRVARAGCSSSAVRSSPRRRPRCRSPSKAATTPALRAMLGQSQNQTFTIGTTTEVLVWHKGIPAVGVVHRPPPTTGCRSTSARRTARRSPTSRRTRPASSATTARTPARPASRCSCTAAPSTAASPAVTSSCTSRAATALALRSLLGQSSDQTFSYDDNTIFLLWQGKVPTVISPSQLKAGDRITVRIRAPRAPSSRRLETTPARHVGEHEPANAPDKS